MVYVALHAVFVPPDEFHAPLHRSLLPATVKAGIAVRYEIPFVIRLEDVYDGVMHYPVRAERQYVYRPFLRLEDNLAPIL